MTATGLCPDGSRRQLPTLDAVAFGLPDPAEFPVLELIGLRLDVANFREKQREHRVQVVEAILHNDRILFVRRPPLKRDSGPSLDVERRMLWILKPSASLGSGSCRSLDGCR